METARDLMSEQKRRKDEGKLLNAAKKKIKTAITEKRGSKYELVKTDSKVKK